MSNFIENVKNEIDSEKTLTENGATAYVTSGKELLDLNFNISTFRNSSDIDIENAFAKAYFENPKLAVKWLFFARDVREGIGERRLFRVCIKKLARLQPKLVASLVECIGEYGRFDDMLCLLEMNDEVKNAVVDFIAGQLLEDVAHMEDYGKPCSLLAKWLPSMTTSSKKTVALAKKLARLLGMTDKQYRKTLSKLRRHLDVIEVKASSNRWNEIDYNAVPSMANLKYMNAFLKHDMERRREYLDRLSSGDEDVKINSSVSFPCDIVGKYIESSSWNISLNDVDPTLEAMWKALPDYVKDVENKNTLVVLDGSGSMTSRIGNTSMTASNVAQSLAIYFAEHMQNPEFKDKFITFSTNPRLVDMSNCKSLHDKLELAASYDECSNTNLERTMDLILDVVVKHNMKQEDIPNLLILSDMNFDRMVDGGDDEKTLMENIEKKWSDAGYRLPRITYWNIIGGYGRKAPIPVQTSENGIALVSGFSTAIASMIYSSKIDPYDVLVEKLNSKRYDVIEKICVDFGW